jgi:putative exosortase-associated protein (TIGR04073 family)
MKTHFLAVGALLAAFSFSSHAEQSYAATIGEKFGTGAVNVATGVAELPRTMYAMSLKEGVAEGLTLGFFKGIGNMLGRTLMGAVDLVSFPIPTKPMVNPPLVWQDFDRETLFNSTWELYTTR